MYIAWRAGEERRGPITYGGPETDEIYYTAYDFNGTEWVYVDG